jgi:hypothetical protein
MKVMAKHANNKVSTIKLPNGQYTQTGKENSEFTSPIQNRLIIRMDRTNRTWAYADAERTGATGTWPNV